MLPTINTLGAFAVYCLVGGLVFAESGLLIGFFLPGDTVLFAAGLYSGDPASGVSVVVLAVIVVVCAVLGDIVAYWFGRSAGPPLLRRDGRILNQRNLGRARDFYDRYGGFAVVAARWIPWVRTFAPILAGVTQLPYGRFLAANIVGALTWGAGLVVLGHLAAATPGLRNAAVAVGAGVVALSGVLAAVRAYRQRSAARR